MTRIHNLLIPAIIILLLCCPAAYAGEDDDSDLSMRVPDVRLVNVEPGSINFAPDMTDMINGWTKTEEITAVVSANTNWVLTIKGSEEYWEGPWQKPVSDIYWNLAGGEYQPLTTQSTEVASGGKCNGSGYPIHMKVELDLSQDAPGEYYYYVIIFELTSP